MLTIKEVADKMDVSEHTLRFWAKSGFFPFLKRDKNNIRKFSEEDLEWVRLVKCLRNVGTENKAIKKYIELCIVGDSTLNERFSIIKETKQKALERLSELNKQLELLDWKEKHYKNLLNGTKKPDRCNPVNL